MVVTRGNLWGRFRTLHQRLELGLATVARIYHQFTRRKPAERLSLDCPRYLGIDEHTLHKSQRFCTTFCDLKNRRVFDVQRGRSEADIAAFLRKLKGRERVRVICIDLSSSYRNLVRRYFPNARLVADRFHVVRVIQHHFMTLARHLAANLKSHRGNFAANTLEDWQEPIACMWRFVRNNGITEGFHRKMKLIQRRAYGFRNFENYRLRVIAQCG
jgi:transposase